MVFSSENSINKMISNLIISRTILFLYHSYFDIHFVYQKNAINKMFAISVQVWFSFGVTNAFSFQFSPFDNSTLFLYIKYFHFQFVFFFCHFQHLSFNAALRYWGFTTGILLPRLGYMCKILVPGLCSTLGGCCCRSHLPRSVTLKSFQI